MNAEIIELVAEALSQYHYDEAERDLPSIGGRPSEDDLRYELDQLQTRMDVINEDIFAFSDRLSNMKVETSHDAFVRQMLIRRMSELNGESEKLWDRSKIIKQTLRKNSAGEKISPDRREPGSEDDQ